MNKSIIPIVEGQAEVESVPILLRRILTEFEDYSLEIVRPFRVKRNRIVRPDELERAIKQSIRSRPNAVGIIVLLDADDDCPAILGPQLLKRCRSTTHLPATVILANRELECWFLGAKESLRGIRGISTNATAPHNPEGIRGTKERLQQNMQGRRYLGVDDQPALAEGMDMKQAKTHCPSFDKFFREVGRMISQLRKD
jgi:hypothetical protein